MWSRYVSGAFEGEALQTCFALSILNISSQTLTCTCHSWIEAPSARVEESNGSSAYHFTPPRKFAAIALFERQDSAGCNESMVESVKHSVRCSRLSSQLGTTMSSPFPSSRLQWIVPGGKVEFAYLRHFPCTR